VEVDPKARRFQVGSVFVQALSRAVIGALASPLRWLGLLFGTEGPPHALPIDPIPFAAGSGELDQAGRARLEQVARILVAHTGLDLVVKAQISADDAAALGGGDLAALAQERAEAVRDALVGGEVGPAFARDRVIVTPWTPGPGGKLDDRPGAYVELQTQ
jgi:hypothetical protein